MFVKLENPNSTILDRTERQLYFEDLFVFENKGCGTLEASTGFGKTKVALDLVERLLSKNKERTSIVIVPTINLKDQWEDSIRQRSIRNIKVYVINTISNSDLKYFCDFLILDEIHKYAAETFKRVFDLIQRRFLLGLTATMDRLDGKHIILENHCPIIDSIPLSICKSRGWVSNFKEYNIGIIPNEAQQLELDTLKEQFDKYFKFFNHDFKIMQTVLSEKIYPYKKRREDGNYVVKKPIVVSLAEYFGWSTNKSLLEVYETHKKNKTLPKINRVKNIWGGGDPANEQFHPENIVIYAIQCQRVIHSRKKLLFNFSTKKDVIHQILKKYPNRKAIVFSESINFANELHSELENSVLYHSKMPDTYIDDFVYKKYKTESGYKNFITENPDWEYFGFLNNTHSIRKKVSKKLSKKDAAKLSIERFKNDDSIKVIISARSLDQGSDFPEASLGIDHSRTSSSTQHVQRVGRVSRYYIFENGKIKKSLFFNTYVKNTKDEDWLLNAQQNSTEIGFLDSLDEIETYEPFRIV